MQIQTRAEAAKVLNELEKMPIHGNAYHDAELFNLGNSLLAFEGLPWQTYQRTLLKMDQAMGCQDKTPKTEEETMAIVAELAEYRNHG